MARIRSIKPEFWTSEQIMMLKPLTRLLFIGMWNFADDYGRMAYAPATIKAQVLPGDTMEIQAIKDMLTELSSAGLILIYAVRGREYIEITGWSHQRIDRPHKPKYPGPVSDEPETDDEPPPNFVDPSTNIRGTFDAGEDKSGEDKKEDICPVADATRVLESQFEEFLRAYPKRGGSNPKPPALKAFVKAVKSGVDPPTLIGAARRYAEAEKKNIGTEFIPMTASWLNKRYFDQYMPDPAALEKLRSQAEMMRSKGYELDEATMSWRKTGEAA
jgi:hypothetical protein